MKHNLKWSTGNSKLKKLDTVSFGLPAIKACPMAGSCASVCYATQGTYKWKPVAKARDFNFTLAKQANFQSMLIEDLKTIKNKIVRIHDSGDFFSQDYLNAWFNAIKLFPKKKFYAYTKSLHLDWSGTPANLQVIQSQGGKLDHLIDVNKSHSRIFATEENRLQAGYIDGNENDLPAIEGKIKIGLVYHGVKNLTINQAERFA